jgi:hypothetical protein
MSAEQPIDIVLTYGVISFDGRVLELFGKTGGSPERLHMATIRTVEYDGGDVKIGTTDQTTRSVSLTSEDEGKRGDLESLLDTVRRASPNLEVEEGK